METIETQPHAEATFAGANGEMYLTTLARLHDMLMPRTYFEIGSRTGDSLALAKCHSIAIDPLFSLRDNFMNTKPSCHLFSMTSDAFFDQYDPTMMLGGKIDLAFLDGLHLAEFLLRDFMNTERHCRSNSVIAMHDCVPLDAGMTRRTEHAAEAAKTSRQPMWWTGDVWKVVVVLREFRPDLRILVLDSHPTGLVLVTGLNPNSVTLPGMYPRILDRIVAIGNGKQAVDNFLASLPLTSSADFQSFEQVSRYFWL